MRMPQVFPREPIPIFADPRHRDHPSFARLPDPLRCPRTARQAHLKKSAVKSRQSLTFRTSNSLGKWWEEGCVLRGAVGKCSGAVGERANRQQVLMGDNGLV